jgi:hypothetical protein
MKQLLEAGRGDVGDELNDAWRLPRLRTSR